MRVFVLDKNKQPLMPCHPARARELLGKGKACVFRQVPFTLILRERAGGVCQDLSLQIDPGSQTTGLALVAIFKNGHHVICGAHLNHRGREIKKALDQRRAIRRGRRFRQTRYRPARFNNRKRNPGWLPPSLQSRVDNIFQWSKKLSSFAPITQMAVETVRFDIQKIENPEICGVTYQQGTLFGYEVREYLLEKGQRQCIYCKATATRLEIDHVIPKSLGGTDRIDNLVLCCRSCNEKKGNKKLSDFLKDAQKVHPILSFCKKTFKDAAAVNASRKAIGEILLPLGKPLSFWSGGRTKYNRIQQNLCKAHWLDAACIGDLGATISIPKKMSVLEITATGRGSRQQCLVNRFGFPRSLAKQKKRVFGF